MHTHFSHSEVTLGLSHLDLRIMLNFLTLKKKKPTNKPYIQSSVTSFLYYLGQVTEFLNKWESDVPGSAPQQSTRIPISKHLWQDNQFRPACLFSDLLILLLKQLDRHNNSVSSGCWRAQITTKLVQLNFKKRNLKPNKSQWIWPTVNTAEK